jgi:hypothetical protein
MTGRILQNASASIGNSSVNLLEIWFNERKTRMMLIYGLFSITFHDRHVKHLMLSIGPVPTQNIIHVMVIFVVEFLGNSFVIRDTIFIL